MLIAQVYAKFRCSFPDWTRFVEGGGRGEKVGSLRGVKGKV